MRDNKIGCGTGPDDIIRKIHILKAKQSKDPQPDREQEIKRLIRNHKRTMP